MLVATGAGFLFCVWCLTVIFRRGLANGRRHLFAPVVLISGYMLLGIGVRGLVTLAGGPNKIEGGVDPTSAEFQWLYTAVFAYAFVGLLALLVGDALAERILPTQPVPDLPPPPSRSNRAILAGIGLGLFAAMILVIKLGTVILSDPAFVATAGTFGLFWLYPLLSAPMYGLAFSLGDGYRRKQLSQTGLMAALLLAALVTYVLTSSKSAIISAAMLILVTRHFLVRPVPLKSIAFASALFTVALPVFYLHRSVGLQWELLRTVQANTIVRGFFILLNRSYLADSFAAILRYTPHPYDFQLGHRWLEVFYFWIPRGIWPGKPVSYGLVFPQTYLSSLAESQGSFFSPTLLGDAYLNFGPLGVPLMLFLFGLALGLWYRFLTQRKVSTARIVVYAASVYWIAISPEQSFEVSLELSISYVTIVALVAGIGSGALWWPQVRPAGRSGPLREAG